MSEREKKASSIPEWLRVILENMAVSQEMIRSATNVGAKEIILEIITSRDPDSKKKDDK